MSNRSIPTPPAIKARIAAAAEADRRFRLQLRFNRAVTKEIRLLAELANMPADAPEYQRSVLSRHFADTAVTTTRLAAELRAKP